MSSTKTLWNTLRSCLLGFVLLSAGGCASRTLDLTQAHLDQNLISTTMRTAYDLCLLEMAEHQYKFRPVALSRMYLIQCTDPKYHQDQYSSKIALIPAHTQIHVEKFVRVNDPFTGVWDYILGNLTVEGRIYEFEYLVGLVYDHLLGETEKNQLPFMLVDSPN